ncbi:CpsD/CapB family tyrosine-protein kinase [Sphingomonas bacterium]|uniref:CpsD/CapB family tyrosine-protein kinase n=1 Tax=Sphingomonas bacterium TaxID=1895847 RepID=UPI00157704B7|nr:CpsD/CapB family tyrosine-protein kinase [Sphingomonas bacterium]
MEAATAARPLAVALAGPLAGPVEWIELVNVVRRGVFGFNSRDRRSRPFNLLRAQVIKEMKAQGWKRLGITSATPAVGKTFIASNLSASLSRVPDQRTLLFDLDLRRGSVATQYGLTEQVGLESYLDGRIETLGPVARAVTGSNLVIYPSVPLTEGSSAELLAGKRARALTEAMVQLSDQHLCICDLPPAFANDDASIALQQLDAFLLVVEEGRTTARQVRDAIKLLAPVPCIGTVLNRYNGVIGTEDYGFGYHSQGKYDAYYS